MDRQNSLNYLPLSLRLETVSVVLVLGFLPPRVLWIVGSIPDVVKQTL
jgi:hypothetical protein